ncbi:Uncharacterised protein [Mycobacteroides abscessus subsp. abscessus]|nr:Uncharacterised protein [Mycobacteroides abscessus subsp. abscessus]
MRCASVMGATGTSTVAAPADEISLARKDLISTEPTSPGSARCRRSSGSDHGRRKSPPNPRDAKGHRPVRSNRPASRSQRDWMSTTAPSLTQASGRPAGPTITCPAGSLMPSTLHLTAFSGRGSSPARSACTGTKSSAYAGRSCAGWGSPNTVRLLQ